MMKKSIFILFMGFISFLNAYDANISNLKLSSEKTEAAIEVYNTEIKLFEDSHSPAAHPAKKLLSMYSERADLHFARKNFHAALRDYQKMISYIEEANVNEPSDLLGGVCGCLFCYQCLDEEESAKQEFNKLIYYVASLGEEIETVDWFRNSPVYPIYKEKFMHKLDFVHF